MEAEGVTTAIMAGAMVATPAVELAGVMLMEVVVPTAAAVNTIESTGT